MKNSFLIRRFFILLISAFLLWIVLTTVLYSFVAQPVFMRIKAREIFPRAERLIQNYAPASPNSEMAPFFTQSIAQAYELYGNWIFVVDSRADVILNTPLPDIMRRSEQEIYQSVLDQHRDLIKNKSGRRLKELKLTTSDQRFMVLSVAITKPYDPESIVGSLVILQPLEELNASTQSLNFALFTSSFIVIILMIIPAAVALSFALRPVQAIREVALSMREGDFSRRANDNYEGEIGDLARAMNELAENLSVLFGELQEQKNSLQQIIDGIAEGIIAVDRDGRVINYNDKVRTVFGLGHSFAVSPAPEQLLQHTRLDRYFEEALEKREQINYVISKDHRQISCTITPLFSEQRVLTGAVGLFRDVTEAERLEQTRRDYIANISHELRTPLTSMRALLEPLSEGMVRSEEARARYYNILLHETLRLSRLINDMLELSRIQAGVTAIELGPVALVPLVTDLAVRYAPIAEKKDIHLRLTGRIHHFPYVWSNEDRVEQILIILLDNAIKFTPDGGEIELRLDVGDDGEPYVAVKDSGCGIRPEDIDHVFDRFFKADKAHNEPGTGLGLSIAHEIAGQMGQTLNVRSELDQGAVFYLTFSFADDVMQSVDKMKDVYDSDASLSDEDDNG